MIRSLLVILVLTGLGLPERAGAQDLEPRRWSHLPIGQTIVGVGYGYTEANVFFSPVLKLTDGTSRINALGVSAIHTFDLAGKSARISLLLPYLSGRWEGDMEGEFQIVHRKGGGDPRLRLSVNLYGAPALKGSEFVRYRTEHSTNTVIGASIAMTVPLGKYCDDCLINIGNNRWSVRPQVGVVRQRQFYRQCRSEAETDLCLANTCDLRFQARLMGFTQHRLWSRWPNQYRSAKDDFRSR
jgi:hypothetical protein